MSFLVPFFIFYFVMELATAIGYIYMVVKKRLALRWPAILCCPFCTLMMMAMGILHTKRTTAK